MLPADSVVMPHYGAVMSDPRVWGADSLEWRPARFIHVVKDGSEAREEFRTPARGSFIAWSEGAADCPGRNFAQVEFVAAMVALFRGGWRVDPVRRDGESLDAARGRVLDLIENDSGAMLLLQMLHPERAPLVWKRK